ncbi:MAG: putative molybdenum carrier protein [Planctomycetaceae bacterium]
MRILRIVSGGQTGVDRAALEVAQQIDLSCGGWCPRGRIAEDGRIPDRFPLQETDSAKYDVRTRRNVADSDGTLVLTLGDPTGGTSFTIATAERLGKPLLVLDLDLQPRPELVREWIALHAIETLNIAGPRESTAPGVGRLAAEFLRTALNHTMA